MKTWNFTVSFWHPSCQSHLRSSRDFSYSDMTGNNRSTFWAFDFKFWNHDKSEHSLRYY